MTKNFENFGEKILAQLSGQVDSDKELLINSIHKIRGKENSSADCAILANKLYEILVQNGLSESDVINPERLFDKVEAFIYEKKYQIALEILEVLDGIEPAEPFNADKKKIYYVNNIVEALMVSTYAVNHKQSADISYCISSRQLYCIMKANIYLMMNNMKDAKACVEEILDFNPIAFDANIFLCNFYQPKQLEKIKKQLYVAYNYAYTREQMVIFLRAYANCFIGKKEFLTAYCCLRAVEFFDDISLVQADLNELIVEINKNNIDKFEIPTKEQVLRILKRENIAYYVCKENFELLSAEFYNSVKEDNFANADYIEKVLIGISGNDTDYIEQIKKLANDEKNGGKK